MATEQPQDKEIDFDADINFVRNQRMKILKNICNDSGDVPDDRDKQRTALLLLDQISKDAIAIKRIKTEESSAATAADKVANAAKLLSMISPVELMRSYAELAATMPNRQPPALSSDIPHAELLPGESSTIVATETYTSFAARTGLDGTKSSGNTPD